VLQQQQQNVLNEKENRKQKEQRHKDINQYKVMSDE
jgi:hypothetical protein